MAQSNLELPRWPDDASDTPVGVNPDGILGGISWPVVAPGSLGLTDSGDIGQGRQLPAAYRITATEPVPFALDPMDIDARLPDLGAAADQNRQFYSAAGGTVTDAGWENPRNHNQGYGYRIRVRGKDGLLFTYGHTDPDSAQVHVGDQVNSGQYLGRYGDPTNGRSTGPHTHFEVRDPSHPLQREYDAYIKNSRAMGALVNPTPYVGTVLPNGVISGHFGPRTMRGRREFHPGVDLKGP